MFTSTVDDLVKEAHKFNVDISVRQTFTDDPTDAVANLKVEYFINFSWQILK